MSRIEYDPAEHHELRRVGEEPDLTGSRFWWECHCGATSSHWPVKSRLAAVRSHRRHRDRGHER